MLLTIENAVALEWSELQQCFHIQQIKYYRGNTTDQYDIISIVTDEIASEFIETIGRSVNITYLEIVAKWVEYCKNNNVRQWMGSTTK